MAVATVIVKSGDRRERRHICDLDMTSRPNELHRIRALPENLVAPSYSSRMRASEHSILQSRRLDKF